MEVLSKAMGDFFKVKAEGACSDSAILRRGCQSREELKNYDK